MYQALYRKYRPQNFEDVVGQKVIVKTLMNAIKNNKITHAYIFAGPRGTGKTSIAKIFAKTINCENLNNLVPCDKCNSCIQFNNKQTVDIIEIDAASNNGVDEIREIKNKVNLVPSNGKYKVYIIDEVHMLTTAAFNAMLKTLEEPPKNVIFILATTEPHKIPLTILSRCQRFDFKRLSNNEIVKRLNQIVEEENIQISEEALKLIAEISNGGMRDSIGLLDQLITYCDSKIELKDVHEINGSLNNEQIFVLIKNIIEKNFEEVYLKINEYDANGKNLSIILEQMVNYLKDLLIYNNCPKYFESNDEVDNYEELNNISSETNLYTYIDIFLETLQDMKFQNNKKMLMELSVLKIKEREKKEKSVDKHNLKSDENDIIKFSNNDEKKYNICDVKKNRINNTLANFDKKDLLKMKNSLGEIQNYLNDSKFSSVSSLILDGELKAYGKNYMIFVYKNETLENYFNSQLLLIENFLFEVFNVKYKVIAVNTTEWEIIKNEFNDNLKNKKKCYIFVEEEYNLEDIFNVSREKKQIVKNDIDKMFGEIVEYK